jgi:hypothetical protein
VAPVVAGADEELLPTLAAASLSPASSVSRLRVVLPHAERVEAMSRPIAAAGRRL